MRHITSVQTVYGSLMHHSAELQALQDAAHLPPYNAPPKAPVLYIKPANTFSAFGDALHLSATQAQIHARACVGLIYKLNQPFAGIEAAQNDIKNIVIADWQVALLCDFSLPHASFYRPPLRFNALDGSLALPQTWLPGRRAVCNISRLKLGLTANARIFIAQPIGM
jgi:5-oxopent-3-ene-1,2,5-tricarboxylate decarboxylase / 2-hydroxyhepta-2,4-diene-1,7-dioate isomerase